MYGNLQLVVHNIAPFSKIDLARVPFTIGSHFVSMTERELVPLAKNSLYPSSVVSYITRGQKEVVHFYFRAFLPHYRASRLTDTPTMTFLNNPIFSPRNSFFVREIVRIMHCVNGPNLVTFSSFRCGGRHIVNSRICDAVDFPNVLFKVSS